MPLVYQQNINEVTRLGVWHLAEAENFFLNRVSLQKTITHPHKRLQHLAGRYLLTELYEDFPLSLIEIADTKKPFLPNEAYHFSISHCEDYAAVMVSPVHRVGVDIEVVSEKVSLIKNKFLSPEEHLLLADIHNTSSAYSYNQLHTMCWSIKESMFKWYGLGSVDFKNHLHIDAINIIANEFSATCRFTKGESIAIRAHGLLFNNNVLSWLYT